MTCNVLGGTLNVAQLLTCVKYCSHVSRVLAADAESYGARRVFAESDVAGS